MMTRAQAAELMTAAALADFDQPPADHTIAYGDDPLQFGELRLPDRDGPYPVIALLHGGVWLSEYTLSHCRKLAAALTGQGFATWTLEYRRVGDAGGGWPGTFDDVSRGFDHLVHLASRFDLDLGSVLAMGHSAGGHLAIWLANRPRRFAPRLLPRALVGLAPAADLRYLEAGDLCGDVVRQLLGGSPLDVPERYDWTSCSERLPLHRPLVVVVGQQDADWGPVSRRFVEQVRAQGEPVELIEIEAAGHFEVIDPDSESWPWVLEAVGLASGAPDQTGLAGIAPLT